MASQTIDDQRQRLDTSWAGHTTMTERFDAFRALDDEARGAWVAFSIARTLEPSHRAFFHVCGQRKSRGLILMPSVGWPGMIPDPSRRSGM